MSSDGFFLMHRGWRDNPLFRGEFSRADAWVWMIENACWRPSRTRIKGETIELQRGELSFSQRFLAEKWGWSKSKVDRFIADLRAESMIETRSKIGATSDHNAGQGQAIIRLCNYEKYQGVEPTDRGNNGATSGSKSGQQRGKEEQGNKGTREEEASASPSPRARKQGVDHPLPEDWEPVLTPAAQKIVDGWPPGMFERERMKFENHARTHGRLAKDWQAAFRTWIINSEERRNDRSPQAGRGAPVYPERDKRSGIARALDDDIARLEHGRSEQPPRAAGRRDAGDGGHVLPIAGPRS